MRALVSASLGSGWIRLHPESLENIPTLQQAKPGLSPDAMNNQNNVGKHWEANPNWSGACDELAKIAKPTLVITGTDDNAYQPHVNSLKIVEKFQEPGLYRSKMLVMQCRINIRMRSVRYCKHFFRLQPNPTNNIFLMI